jgi:hypothetical protein
VGLISAAVVLMHCLECPKLSCFVIKQTLKSPGC